ncbi:serine/threonine-protein kinase PknK [Archangium primigenium]|uniref:serine/threonine-protein kinase n=1 Tax=[Archangium] primigenium TaxID=2792470 RepID=UPI0019578AFD|nr:serine/threonine-protein kinase [Archangium primigenium]MBM7114990.1 protein kinase [Archangium primigenium]
MDHDKTAPSSLPAGVLAPDTLIQGRFTLGELAGRGGMGHVYRARDGVSGLPVALKVLHSPISPEVVYRFNREAVLLESLHHPGIVAHVAHGTTERGQPFLCMEWVEGEELSRRLARQPLSLPETLALLRRAAEALAHAHQRGIVHRDIKPSNLLLRGGRPEDVVVLDFGLARHTEPTLVGVTGTHTVVGTPGYMSPEQASSQSEIPPAADIFSLGCVLYECLTGKPPFSAPHFAAALAKILFADPEPLHSVRPGLPVGLQVLIDRMLAKDPRRRMPDADRLLEALNALEAVPELLLPRAEPQAAPIRLPDAEQRLVSVLLISLRGLEAEDKTALRGEGAAVLDSLRTTLWPQGTRVELLADGSLVATLAPDRGTATDQAALAARCALTFKERWPEASVVLVTGLGVLNERLPVGAAMDRVGLLLSKVQRMPGPAQVVLDEVTAGLLGPGFQLSRIDASMYLLHAERLSTDESRPLMGKPTPCVGREQELALLDFTLSASIEDQQARVVLVMAPPGVGKSRLRHEFLRRLERRAEPVQVMLGLGDPLSAGASVSLLGQALRRWCGLPEGANLEARRTRLYQRVSAHLPEALAQDTVEFLGELCAIPFPDEYSPRLRAARSDPRLMSAQLGPALVAFLKAECTHQPVLLVLEDLHWSDALTVRLIEESVRELADQPFMVLALARPEVKEVFPGLWSRHVQEVVLKGLSRKACTGLVREVLGPQVSAALVQRAVEQSDGNALLLEELIRTMAEGHGVAVPGTVLAVLQTRLLRMHPEVRHVLLAASVFGHTFWFHGLKELLGTPPDALTLQVRQLVEEEVIVQQSTSRFASTDEYHFRHALVRDAAYALVADSHRVSAHRLAALWLEQMGETDALVLAAHHQSGKQPERAAHFHLLAAEQLFERHDLVGALRCVEAGLEHGVGGHLGVRLRALHSVVLTSMDQLPRAMEIGGPVLDELEPGSPLWCRLAAGLVTGHLFLGHQAQLNRVSQELLWATPHPEAMATYVEACAYLGGTALWTGMRQWIELPLARIQSVAAAVMEKDPVVRGWALNFRSQYLHYFEPSPWQGYQLSEGAQRSFLSVGMQNQASVGLAQMGVSLAALGDVPGALELLREAEGMARSMENRLLTTFVHYALLRTLTLRADPQDCEEIRARVGEWLGGADADPFRRGLEHLVLSRVALIQGLYAEAEDHARQSCDALRMVLTFRLDARASLCQALLSRGASAEALQVATEGVRELKETKLQGAYAVAMHLALVEAHFALEDTASGERALRETLDLVHLRAADIPEPRARERFLRQVPENARTLQLAHARWGSPPSAVG